MTMTPLSKQTSEAWRKVLTEVRDEARTLKDDFTAYLVGLVIAHIESLPVEAKPPEQDGEPGKDRSG
jgi:hypothetical protein